jgi:hypothetical protein
MLLRDCPNHLLADGAASKEAVASGELNRGSARQSGTLISTWFLRLAGPNVDLLFRMANELPTTRRTNRALPVKRTACLSDSFTFPSRIRNLARASQKSDAACASVAMQYANGNDSRIGLCYADLA